MEKKKKKEKSRASLQRGVGGDGGGVRLSSVAFSCAIYQLNSDEMSSEAASTRSAHNLEVVLGASANLPQWTEQLH